MLLPLDLPSFSLATPLWQNPLEDWLFALGVALVLAILFTLIRRVVNRRLHRLAGLEQTVKFPISRFIGALWTPVLWALSLYLGALYLNLPPKKEHFVDSALVVAIIVQAALWLNLLLTHWVATKSERTLKNDAAAATTLRAVGILGRIVIWSIALLMGLDNLGVNVTALVAGLGVGGIAIALAAQSVLGDLFASLSIVVDRPFVIGDFIVFDTNFKGTIEHIGLRSTRIRASTGEEIIVPNSELLKAKIRNFKRLNQRQVTLLLGITYSTPPAKVEKLPAIIQQVIESVPHTRFENAYFKAYGDFALQFEVVYQFTKQNYDQYVQTQHLVNLALLKRFAKEKIAFAYPTQTLHIQKSV